MSCGGNLKKHIIEHEILGLPTSSGVIGSDLTVKDEGIIVQTGVNTIDFIGDAVNVTEVSGITQVEVRETTANTQRYFFSTTQENHGYSVGKQLIAVYKDTALGWLPAQANDVNTLALGFITEVFNDDEFEITLGGRVTISGHSLVTEEYYFLSTSTAGDVTIFEPISGVIAPVLYVEDDANIIIDIQRANEVEEDPPEVIARIQGLEISVSGLDEDFADLEDRTEALETGTAQGSGSPNYVGVWYDTNTISGYNNFRWNKDTNLLTVVGNISITGTVDGRDISTDGTTLTNHVANNSIHFTKASIDHTQIQNIGTNSHSQIDTHIADNSIHTDQSLIDHGTISGLDDDDHTLYAPVDGSRPVSIGAPTDGTYGGILSINNSDTVADTVDRINDLLALISPAAPGDLTGTNLSISISTYTGKLPSGLSGNWGSYTPGDTITTLVTTGTYSLLSTNTGSSFNGGLTTDTGGTVTHILNSVAGSARNVSDGVGSTGTVQITDISTYNSIWQKINAQLNVTVSEGETVHAMQHTLAGTTNDSTIYYDDTATAPSFSASPTFTLFSETLKYLSGIAYYDIGTQFDVSYTAAAGIFQKVYHATQVSRISCTGLSNVTVNPGGVPAVGSTFIVTNERVTLNASNQANISSPRISVLLNKPDGQNTSQNTSVLARNICTYGIQSTTTYDNFVDEARRLVLGTSTSWTSSNALTNGNAQVRAGYLQYPDTGEYPGFTGDQSYERRITKASASSGTITFGGIVYTNIASYNTGNLNVFLQLETDGVWFDLGRSFGSDNGNGSGDSLANSKGARNDGSSSGSNLVFTFGTYNTANNSNQYRIRIVFKNSTYSLTSITAS